MGKKSGKALPKAAKKKTAASRKRPVTKAKRAAPAARGAAKKKPAPRRAAPRPPADQAMRELAKRIVDVTLANDDDAAFALYADGVESTEMGMPASVGIDAIRQKFVMWRSMVTDATFQPRRVWVDGNTIIIEWDGRVTLAASGRTVDLPEIAVHEVQNGKIARERFYYDPTILRS
jgi:ketosteroid isomerase-like protein